MKNLLLLSSGRFLQKHDLSQVFDRSLKGLRIAHIITASLGEGCTSFEHLDRVRAILKEQECYVEDIDIASRNEEELRLILEKFDGVFVNGGNTFYLLQCIKKSGFDKILKELLPNGFLYIGASAGSLVLCPSIETALSEDQNKYSRYGMTDFTAMNIVPFLLQVHYKEEQKENIKEKTKKVSCKVRILKDDQAILVKDNKYIFMGEMEEIIL